MALGAGVLVAVGSRVGLGAALEVHAASSSASRLKERLSGDFSSYGQLQGVVSLKFIPDFGNVVPGIIQATVVGQVCA